jgi:hypothetical protein
MGIRCWELDDMSLDDVASLCVLARQGRVVGHPRQDGERPYCTAPFRLEPTTMSGSAILKVGKSVEKGGD